MMSMVFYRIPDLALSAASRGTTASPVESRRTVSNRLDLSCSTRSAKTSTATLYKGRDRRKRLVMVRSLKKPVALGSARDFERLEKELKRLKHPAIVPILKLIGESRVGRVIAVVSEFSTAPTLSQRLNQSGLPDLREAAFFVLVLADALEYAGRRLMIHGNLTPSHILIGDDGKPRITGFGLASLECGPDVSCATVRVYVAPELLQIPGRPADGPNRRLQSGRHSLPAADRRIARP